MPNIKPIENSLLLLCSSQNRTTQKAMDFTMTKVSGQFNTTKRRSMLGLGVSGLLFFSLHQIGLYNKAMEIIETDNLISGSASSWDPTVRTINTGNNQTTATPPANSTSMNKVGSVAETILPQVENHTINTENNQTTATSFEENFTSLKVDSVEETILPQVKNHTIYTENNQTTATSFEENFTSLKVDSVAETILPQVENHTINTGNNQTKATPQENSTSMKSDSVAETILPQVENHTINTGNNQTKATPQENSTSMKSASVAEMILPQVEDYGCDMTVMIETNNGTAYLKELVTYYLSHGAKQVHVHDNSDVDTSNNVQSVLNYYIEKGLVTFVRALEPFSRQRQQLGLTDRVQHLIRNESIFEFYPSNSSNQQQQTKNEQQQGSSKIRPHWLITIDDDEFMYPDLEFLRDMMGLKSTEDDHFSSVFPIGEQPKTSLLQFLCSPTVLKYGMVRFAYRQVGSNNITVRPPDKLDIETYTRMERRPGRNDKRIGKSAYHINHPNMTVEKWMLQDEPTRGAHRRGGAFFLHGNNFRFSSAEFNMSKPAPRMNEYCLEAGFAYHFARSKEERTRRKEMWAKIKVQDGRDKNEVECSILETWGNHMRSEGWISETFFP